MNSSFPRKYAGFTLVELLAVIAIIAILAGLTLSAFSGVMTSAARNRTHAEIASISAALESYKTDNGIYPPAYTFSGPSAYKSAISSTTGGPYQLSSETLYESLTSETNAASVPTGAKSYITLKSSQLGTDAGDGNYYIKDPFGNSYGYYTGNPAVPMTTSSLPYNGTNQFDLWSTGGDVQGVTNATWISNWGAGGG